MVIYLLVCFSFFRIYPDCSFGHFSRLYDFQIGNKSKEQSLQNLRKFFLEGINKSENFSCVIAFLSVFVHSGFQKRK